MNNIVPASVGVTTMNMKWTRRSIPDLLQSTNYPFQLVCVADDATNADVNELNEIVEEYRTKSLQNFSIVPLFGRKHGISYSWNKILEFAVNRNHELVFVMNNDVYYPPANGKCWLERMIDLSFAHPNHSLMSPAWWYTGELKPEINHDLSNRNLDYYKHEANGYMERNKDVIDDGALGCFFMLRTKAIKKLERDELFDVVEPNPGYFDEKNYTCQWEDVDYVFRLHNHGCATGIFHAVTLAHAGSGTIGDKDYQPVLNYGYLYGMTNFLKKWNIPNVSFGQFSVHNSIFKVK